MTERMEHKMQDLVKNQKATGNQYIDLNDSLWESDFADYLEGFKKLGQDKFTISTQQTNMAEMIAKFQELGCKLEGIVDVRDKYRMFDYDKDFNRVPYFQKAFLMSVQ